MTPDLYELCKTCHGSGQAPSTKSAQLGFASLPCPDCELLRVVKVQKLVVECQRPGYTDQQERYLREVVKYT